MILRVSGLSISNQDSVTIGFSIVNEAKNIYMINSNQIPSRTEKILMLKEFRVFELRFDYHLITYVIIS